MRITFPFVVEQKDKNTVEVLMGSGGKQLPELDLRNAAALQRDFSMSEDQIGLMMEKAYETACTELVRVTIKVEA